MQRKDILKILTLSSLHLNELERIQPENEFGERSRRIVNSMKTIRDKINIIIKNCEIHDISCMVRYLLANLRKIASELLADCFIDTQGKSILIFRINKIIEETAVGFLKRLDSAKSSQVDDVSLIRDCSWSIIFDKHSSRINVQRHEAFIRYIHLASYAAYYDYIYLTFNECLKKLTFNDIITRVTPIYFCFEFITTHQKYQNSINKLFLELSVWLKGFHRQLFNSTTDRGSKYYHFDPIYFRNFDEYEDDHYLYIKTPMLWTILVRNHWLSFIPGSRRFMAENQQIWLEKELIWWLLLKGQFLLTVKLPLDVFYIISGYLFSHYSAKVIQSFEQPLRKNVYKSFYRHALFSCMSVDLTREEKSRSERLFNLSQTTNSANELLSHLEAEKRDVFFEKKLQRHYDRFKSLPL